MSLLVTTTTIPDYFDGTNPDPNAAVILDPTAGHATLGVSGQLIDLRGISGWSGFTSETFASTGDIRFVNAVNPFSVTPTSGSPSFQGAFNTDATLGFQGAQLYRYRGIIRHQRYAASRYSPARL